MNRWLALLAAVLTACSPPPADEADSARDRARIVTLAPHLAELTVSAGAGDRLVGVSAYSDFPDSVTTLPVISDAFTVDHEQLRLLQPDLLLAWESGMPASTIDELRAVGYRVEVIRTRGLDDIPAALRRIGELAGVTRTAEEKARQLEEALGRLQSANAGKSALSVFIQVSARPLYTVNREHYLSELVELCGGRNVFADLGELAPNIGVEAVIERRPEVILASSDDDSLADWQRWSGLPAVALGNLYTLPAVEAGRPTTRVLVAARAACSALDAARERVRRQQ